MILCLEEFSVADRLVTVADVVDFVGKHDCPEIMSSALSIEDFIAVMALPVRVTAYDLMTEDLELVLSYVGEEEEDFVFAMVDGEIAYKLLEEVWGYLRGAN